MHSEQLNEPIKKPHKPDVCTAFFCSLFLLIFTNACESNGNTRDKSSSVHWPADKKRPFAVTNSLWRCTAINAVTTAESTSAIGWA